MSEDAGEVACDAVALRTPTLSFFSDFGCEAWLCSSENTRRWSGTVLCQPARKDPPCSRTHAGRPYPLTNLSGRCWRASVGEPVSYGKQKNRAKRDTGSNSPAWAADAGDPRCTAPWHAPPAAASPPVSPLQCWHATLRDGKGGRHQGVLSMRVTNSDPPAFPFCAISH